MAINIQKKKDAEENEIVQAEISNGHLQALKKIVKDYNLPSEKEALIFLLGVISQANGNPVEVGGSKYIPSDALKRGEDK